METMDEIYDNYSYMQMRDKYNNYGKNILDMFNNDVINGVIDETPDLYVWIAIYHMTKGDYDKMEEYCKKAINNNNIDAIYLLGLYYIEKHETRKKILTFIKAAHKGHIRAMCDAGDYYKSIKHYKKMEKYYKLAAEKGNVKAMINLSEHYDKKKENEQSINYLKLAADKKNIFAFSRLLIYYKNQYDYENMKKYIDMIFDDPQINARLLDNFIFVLAEHYNSQYKTNNQPHDLENMLKYYKLAADNSNVSAMLKLAEYYKYIKNLDDMLKYYHMAADKNDFTADAGAMIELAHHYRDKSNNALRDKYYKMASNNKNNIASIELKAIIQNNVDDIKQVAAHYASRNYGEAVYYYELAVRQKDVYAMFSLAKLHYKHGYSTKAANNYKLAAAHGYIPAIMHLKNTLPIDEIKKYYESAAKTNDFANSHLAAENGDINKIKELAKYYYDNDNLDGMAYCDELAIKNNVDDVDVDAIMKLAIYYRKNGDMPRMLKCYTRAAAKNDKIAKLHDKAHQNDVNAMDQLITHYSDINDSDSMIYYCIMAADKDHIKSQKKLIEYYKKHKDTNNMTKYLIHAVRLEDNDAMMEYVGYLGENTHYSEMKYYYEKVYDKDNTNNIASLHMKADNGDITAMMDLAVHYEQINNNNLMVYYYERAADEKDVSAMINLAKYYEAENDNDNKIHYYKLAADHGNVDAMMKLAEYYESIINYDDMEYYYKLAANKKNTNAMTKLAVYYMIMRDYDKMVHYYTSAANENNEEAMDQIIDQLRENSYLEEMPKFIISNIVVDYINESDYIKKIIDCYNTDKNNDECKKNIIANFKIAVNKSINATMPKIINVVNRRCYYDQFEINIYEEFIDKYFWMKLD